MISEVVYIAMADEHYDEHGSFVDESSRDFLGKFAVDGRESSEDSRRKSTARRTRNAQRRLESRWRCEWMEAACGDN